MALVESDTEGAKARILDAAEAEFARGGFAGAAMKAVSMRADVAQGLIHYHFGNKDGLYEAVIARRSAIINAARIAALDEVDTARPGAIFAIFRAFFAPPLGPEGGGVAYARIFAALAVGRDRDRALVARFYNPTAKRFMDAIKRAEPGADSETAAWAYVSALGALVPALGQDDRLERISNGAARIAGPKDTVERLSAFAVGGLRGLIAQKKDNRS